MQYIFTPPRLLCQLRRYWTNFVSVLDLEPQIAIIRASHLQPPVEDDGGGEKTIFLGAEK